ncbi:alpha/beta hydrolase [Pendulispora brunnea]|uniref:Alpha/beta hydrolase n=1 Tax=Pendulispora brunnea TaxID=2905690 RepID=A0ABZ2K725_9BACT
MELPACGIGSLKLLWLVAMCALLGCGGAHSKGPVHVPIWPGAAPDAQPIPGPENATSTETDPLVAGRPWTEVTNVARPTMTVYPPRGKNTGTAVIVFPGGGYKALAVDLEGTEVCDWLTSRGITCVLLKYRVPYSGPYGDASCQCHITPKAPLALEDAQRTISLVRARAKEWHIDPHKIGVLGFSAGGHLVAATSTHFTQRAYGSIDVADRESCRPDFAIALYPGHLWTEENLDLTPDIATRISRDTPPTFLVQAEDDPVDSVNHSLVYYTALKNAEVPVELHLFAHGGHAFGLRRTEHPITEWPQLAETWLRTIGVLPP